MMAEVALSPIQIREIALQSVHFERSAELSRANDDLDFDLNLEIGVGFRGDDPNEALVKVAAAIDWNAEESPFKFSVGYLAFVTQDGTVERETYEKICRSRISVIILGTLRPFVARLMSEANEKFRLPLLDLRRLTAADDQSDRANGEKTDES